ncbi:MAG: manganese efflux pump [Clostridiaceae bacterium]|nr:manganese efflux pump [Clostridiaceae bacterium]
MSLYFILSIAFALSLDAFGVALSIGLNRGLKYNKKVLFSISFGFFQFLFALVGALMGIIFNRFITCVPSVAGGMIMAIVGVMMINEGFKKDEVNILLNPRMYVVLGVSVSIDAMVVGFTALNSVNYFLLVIDCLIIGAISLIMTSIAFSISKYLKKIRLISCYAEYIGGIILVIFGIRIIFS